MSKLTTVYKGTVIKTAIGDEVSFIPGEYNDLPEEWLALLREKGCLDSPEQAAEAQMQANREAQAERVALAARVDAPEEDTTVSLPDPDPFDDPNEPEE